jgi:hypothetical protein
MNRFIIEQDVDSIAKSLCNKHIVKMPLEEAQMLSFAIKRYAPDIEGLQNGPKAHAKHPCTIWAGDNRMNYRYSLSLLTSMCKEYTRRYLRDHKCSLLIPKFMECEKYIPDVTNFRTSHPQCFGKDNDHFKTDENWPIQAYRKYYRWKYDTTDWAKLNKLNPTPKWLSAN